ncbi:hypothetical protein ACFFGV_08180 [Pontibacillus salicampi]|uniref:Uncharacterized protein n=1 Tax=Pontibacillus salicampi TaxID=1449801 RepID=A0ABV6LMN2_9BACI
MTTLFVFVLLVVPIGAFLTGYKFKTPSSNKVPTVLISVSCAEMVWLTVYVGVIMEMNANAWLLILYTIIPLVGFILSIFELRRYPILSAISLFVSLLVAEFTLLAIFISPLT